MWDGKEILLLHRLFETLVDKGVDKVRAQEDCGNKQFLVMIPSTPATEKKTCLFSGLWGFQPFPSLSLDEMLSIIVMRRWQAGFSVSGVCLHLSRPTFKSLGRDITRRTPCGILWALPKYILH